MNTPAHILVALAALSRPASPRQNLAVAAGAFVPDLSIYVFFFWATGFTDFSMQQIWREVYWTEPWQTLGAISNSVPLALVLLGLSLWKRSAVATAFSLALLVHFALDFPLHADDAHRHFWPLSDWRFASPISYWDGDHHGKLGAGLEYVATLIASVFIWRRFQSKWVRIAIGVLALVQGAAFLARLFLR